MIAEFAAVKARLTSLHTVHEVTASGTLTYPYYILWSSSGNAPVERSVRAETTDIDDYIYVTIVGLTNSDVQNAIAAARAALCPNGLPSSLMVTGRVAVLDFFRAEPIQADTSVTLTAGVHPLSGVDMYRLVSVPA